MPGISFKTEGADSRTCCGLPKASVSKRNVRGPKPGVIAKQSAAWTGLERSSSNERVLLWESDFIPSYGLLDPWTQAPSHDLLNLPSPRAQFE